MTQFHGREPLPAPAGGHDEHPVNLHAGVLACPCGEAVGELRTAYRRTSLRAPCVRRAW